MDIPPGGATTDRGQCISKIFKFQHRVKYGNMIYC